MANYYSGFGGNNVSISVAVDNTSVALEELEKAKKTILEVIGGKAEGYAIKEVPTDTSSLKKTIKHTIKDNNTMELTCGGASSPKFVDYAAFVELGTVKKGARPFMTPALEEHQAEWKNVIESTLKK